MVDLGERVTGALTPLRLDESVAMHVTAFVPTGSVTASITPEPSVAGISQPINFVTDASVRA